MNIDATLHGRMPDSNQPGASVDLFLEAGNYKATVTNPDLNPQAQFTAWSNHFRRPGTFRTFARVSFEDGTIQGFGGGYGTDSATEAFEATVASGSHDFFFELNTAQTLRFYTTDTINSFYDNSGGVSVDIVQACGNSTSESTVTFCDTEFNDADWTATIVEDTTSGTNATQSSQQISSGGNSGPYRQTTLSWSSQKIGVKEGIKVEHIKTDVSYDPSVSGPVESLDFRIDVRAEGEGGPFNGFSLLQGGTIYGRGGLGANPFSWVTKEQSALTASDFAKQSGTGPDHPNFSSAGEPIFFGYKTSGSATNVIRDFTAKGGIDNFKVTVNQGEPCPTPSSSTLSLVATADGDTCTTVSDLTGSFSTGGDLYTLLHRQLYPGQDLDTTLIVSNVGNAAATGTVNVTYYLSNSSDSSSVTGDVEVGTANRQVNLAAQAAGQPAAFTEVETKLSFDSNLAILLNAQTVYLKAAIEPGTGITEENTENNIVTTVELYGTGKAFSSCDKTAVEREMDYEAAVVKAKSDANVTLEDVIPSTPSGKINPYENQGNGKEYTTGREGFLRTDVYLDTADPPKPTFGIGFNLARSGAKKLVKEAMKTAPLTLAFSNLTDAQKADLAKSKDGKKLLKALQKKDFVELKYKDLLTLGDPTVAGSKDKIGIEIGGMEALATKLFEDDYKEAVDAGMDFVGDETYGKLTQQIKDVLTDMAFNLGKGTGEFGLSGFTNFRSALVSAFDLTGDARKRRLALAGFHLMDSDYAVQVGTRSLANFRLVVSGAEAWL